MRFRASVLLLFALPFLFAIACSNTPGSSPPILPESASPHQADIPIVGNIQSGHNLLGYWEIGVSADVGICKSVPDRLTGLHLNVLKWLEFGPCTTCLSIADFQVLPNGNYQIEITFTHPFNQPNLTGFDVRGIAMFGGHQAFPEFSLTASHQIKGDAALINADGHTTLYNPSTVNNGFQGYLKGRLAPDFATPNATLNGFKTYYSDPNRRFFQAGDSLSATFLIRPPGPVFTFGYAVDASWGAPSKPVTVPDSFPITANSLEAYLIETSLSNSLATSVDSMTTLTIDVYDWQGATTIDSVAIEGPYFFSGLVNATEAVGGPGTLRFTCELVNEFGAVAQGNYPVLIRVLDTASQPGALIDNTAWRVVDIPVIVNHEPTCSAEVSSYDPAPGEQIMFTDTSTDPEGPGDLDESWWDWENDGTWDEEGFAVSHAFAQPGVFQVNHRITDMAGAEDELDEPLAIDVGMFITLQEDLDTKPAEIGYHYQSLDHSYDSGALINVSDTNGPWDFTTIGLTTGPNWLRVLDDSDPEVSGFVGDFDPTTTHFIKYENMLDPFFPLLYQAEYHHFATDRLFIYGFHDPYAIGSNPIGPPYSDENLAIPYPITPDTDYSFTISEPGFVLNYRVTALGEGDITIPLDGGVTERCLLVRYRFYVSAAEPMNGGTLNFTFVADDGTVLANVIAVNDPPIYNWNPPTNSINSSGMVLFQALHEVSGGE